MPKKKIEEEIKGFDSDTMKKDLMAYVDSELDKRLEKVVSDTLRKEVLDEVEKANKKVIRMKNRKILVKNIFLILFFAIIVFLLYLLYTEHYFDRFLPKVENKDQKEIVEKDTPKKEEVVEEPTLDELKEEYASYLDPYVISDKSAYLDEFYQGKIPKELKNYYALNQMDLDALEVEDDYNTIDASLIQEKCETLFDSGCDSVSFDYNGNKIRYFEKLDSYVTNSVLLREDTLIQREIIDIEVKNDTVSITTLEGVVVGEQLYSIAPNEFISDYYGEGLSSYQEDLNHVIYHFKNKKLVSVEKG